MSDAEKENVIGREEEEAMDINQDVEVIQATVPNLCFAFLPKFFFELDHRIRAFNTQTCIPIGQIMYFSSFNLTNYHESCCYICQH